MAPYDEDDWSDSDDEDVLDVETSVQLGIPDGPLESASDVLDAAVSRIGGHPAFLTSPEPPLESSMCKNCSTPMELLVQVWCPMEESPCDRALYVWGCARGVCQKLEGSVRAWRGLRYNETYAAKLKLKKEKLREKELAKAKAAEEDAKRKSAVKANPFSMKGSSNASHPFGLGAQIFGQAEATPEENDAQEECEDPEEQLDDESESEEDDDDEELVTALAATSLETSEWKASPGYDCLYMSTTAEYLPPAPKAKVSVEAQMNDDDDGKESKSKGSTWALEGYENSLDIDHAFERFSKRVGYEGEQCLRYELGGTPLPFASDKVFDRLFPAPPKPNLPVTKPDSMVVPPAKRTYDPSSIPGCPKCNGKRVFECQLMPNLINVLKKANEDANKDIVKVKQMSDDDRRKAIEKAVKGDADVEKVGMEWGTCLIFSCEKDCCVDEGAELMSCWREEVVLVQWDV